MPYVIVPFKNGYRVQNIHTGEFTSTKPMSKTQCKRQVVAIYLSELHRKKSHPELYKALQHNITGGSHDILGNSVSHNVYKRALTIRHIDPFVDT